MHRRSQSNFRKDPVIGVVGLGYVGLPLAINASKHFRTIGFDINIEKVGFLKSGKDHSNEINETELINSNLTFTHDTNNLKECDFYIVAVPTPIQSNNKPDLQPLVNASKMLGMLLGPQDIVVYESTVYPGATEEICVPLLEEYSNLRFNEDFYVGYSPERVDPGSRGRKAHEITKLVSASSRETLDTICNFYKKVLNVKLFATTSMRVAEASKVLENIQRDVNIALINEVTQIFSEINISTTEVIEAAGTKWNFHSYQPGLVGGHCIGVDPYYLIDLADRYKINLNVIKSARLTNEGMVSYIVNNFLKFLRKKQLFHVNKIFVYGLTFKDNCSDLRNSKSFDMIEELLDHGFEIIIFDPLINKDDLQIKYQNMYLNEDNYNLGPYVTIKLRWHDNEPELMSLIQSEAVYDFRNET